MNFQDFACACSNMVFGRDLGWGREETLEKLFEILKIHYKQSMLFEKTISDAKELKEKNKKEI